jgi:hypothetical protein
VGLGFKRISDQAMFSVGLNCTNSTTTNKNGVVIQDGSAIWDAATKAWTSSQDMGYVELGQQICTITSGNPIGFTNYCILWMSHIFLPHIMPPL